MRIRCGVAALLIVFVVLANLPLSAQLRPERTARSTRTPAPGPTQRVEAQPAPAPAAGTVRVNPKDGLKYVWIPAGSFEMGCSPGDTECDPDEKPRHHVTISKGFWLAQTPVTVRAYKKFVDGTGSRMPKAPKFNAGWTDLEMPMVDVTWEETQPYCKWIGGRLPTEAEWEYAARAGNTAPRYGPLDEIAWYADNSGREHLDSTKIWKEERNRYLGRLFANENKPHDVGQKQPNAFGLYDMLGNVWQYTNDWYGGAYYSSSPATDPPGPKEADVMQYQVLRGGSWADQPVRVRVSYRDGRGQGFQIGIDGFRTVWEEAGP